MTDLHPTGEAMISGFQGMLFLWGWVACVLLHALWRSLERPEPDTLRPSGPYR